MVESILCDSAFDCVKRTGVDCGSWEVVGGGVLQPLAEESGVPVAGGDGTKVTASAEGADMMREERQRPYDE